MTFLLLTYMRYNTLLLGQKKMNISSYPVYHSVHDTFKWMSTFVDPSFTYHKAIAQLWVRVSILLADNLIIPFNCSNFAATIRGHVDSLKKSHKETFKKQNIDLGNSWHSICPLSLSLPLSFHSFLPFPSLTHTFLLPCLTLLAFLLSLLASFLPLSNPFYLLFSYPSLPCLLACQPACLRTPILFAVLFTWLPSISLPNSSPLYHLSSIFLLCFFP